MRGCCRGLPRAGRRGLLPLLALAWLAAPAAHGADRDEMRSFTIPRQAFLQRVRKVGVFRLQVPKEMRLPTAIQGDLERWLFSELATTGLEVERASEVERVWGEIDRRVRFPREPGESERQARRRAQREEWTPAMRDARDLHGGRELRRVLGLDALLIPQVFVIAARPGTEIQGQRPAALCLQTTVVDMDGALLYRDGACVLVFEWPDGDGIKLRASRRELEQPLLRRNLAAASLRALRRPASAD